MSRRTAPVAQRRRSRGVAAATAVALVCGSAFAASGDRAAEYYESALLRAGSQDYRGAVIQLRNALQESPGHLPSRILLGDTYLRLNDPLAARKELKAALASGADASLVVPLLAETYTSLRQYRELLEDIPVSYDSAQMLAATLGARAAAYQRLGRAEEAERAYAEAAALRPGDTELLLGRAGALLRLGRAAEAENLADRAGSLAPGDPEPWFFKGELRRFRQDPSGAEAAYSRALELDSTHLGALAGRAGVRLQQEHFDDAIADVRSLREAHPGHPQSLYLDFLLQDRTGKKEEARQSLRDAAKVLDAYPRDVVEDDVALTLLSGILHYLLGNLETAQVHLARYIEHVPYHTEPREMLADLLLRRDDPAAAARVLESASGDRSASARTLSLLGDAHLRAGRAAAAEPVLRRAVDAEPDNPSLRVQVAAAYLALGRAEAAIEDVRAALRLDRYNQSALELMTRIRLAQGKAGDALETAGALLEQAPGSVTAHLLAGEAHLAAGELSSARASFEQALALDPASRAALLGLARQALQAGEPAAAQARYRHILEGSPRDVDAMVGLARIAAAGETWQEAIDWLERARRANLQVVDALLPLPELYRRIGRPQQALEAAHDLNRRRPMDFRVLAELARAQQAANRSEDAARTLRVLYGLASERPPDLLWIAGLQRQVGDYEAARRSLDAALEILPGFVPAQTERVAVATAEGRLDEALAGARRLQAEYPRLGLPDALAGDVHMRRGEPREAASAYASALAKDDSATIALQLFRARTAARDEAALPGLVAWVEAHPAENAVRRVLADALLAAGRFPEAQAQYEGLAAGQPEDPGVLNNLAWLYQRQGDARGLEYAERAHRLAPEDAAILDTLGWVLLERGDPGRALPYLREAVARAASDPQVHYHLAVALARLGRAEEARHSVLQALRSGRGFAEEQDARALLKTLGGG